MILPLVLLVISMWTSYVDSSKSSSNAIKETEKLNSSRNAEVAKYSHADKQIVDEILAKNSNNDYGILGLHSNANSKEIKNAYKLLALLVHPDKNLYPKSELAFKKLNVAKQNLDNKSTSNDFNRRHYRSPYYTTAQTSSTFSYGASAETSFRPSSFPKKTADPSPRRPQYYTPTNKGSTAFASQTPTAFASQTPPAKTSQTSPAPPSQDSKQNSPFGTQNSNFYNEGRKFSEEEIVQMARDGELVLSNKLKKFKYVNYATATRHIVQFKLSRASNLSQIQREKINELMTKNIKRSYGEENIEGVKFCERLNEQLENHSEFIILLVYGIIEDTKNLVAFVMFKFQMHWDLSSIFIDEFHMTDEYAHERLMKRVYKILESIAENKKISEIYSFCRIEEALAQEIYNEMGYKSNPTSNEMIKVFYKDITKNDRGTA